MSVPVSPSTWHFWPIARAAIHRSSSTKSALRSEDDSVLAAEVREEIASPNRRIVGVVINAVDDQLLKGEQLDMRGLARRDPRPAGSAP